MAHTIDQLRHHSRKLIRELGVLQLNKVNAREQPSYWHTLIEIHKEPNITISKLCQLLLLSLPTVSRIVSTLVKEGYVSSSEGHDKRERFLNVTEKGEKKVRYIDEYSNSKIKRAFDFLSEDEKQQLVISMEKYANALEESRILRDQIKILRLSTSRALRKQVVHLIETIQVEEYHLPITSEINESIIRAEHEYYYRSTCNFWYAVDGQGTIIGCIGLKQINERQGEIKRLCVVPEFRGLGVAEQLLYTLAKNAEKHGFEQLFLGLVDKLTAAKHFYEKSGFVAIKPQLLPQQFERGSLDTDFYLGDVKELKNSLSDLI